MNILLIDDHALFRDGLKLMLEELPIPVETFEAGSYEAAEVIIEETSNIELVLLDLNLPGIKFIDALQAIHQKLPDSCIVILSGTEDPDIVEQALRFGARGYISKSSSTKTMLNALQLVISGDTYVPAEILNGSSFNAARTSEAKSSDKQKNHKLTPRQHDVLIQLAEGKSNKEIGRALFLTESTIRAHVAAILRSFDVSNRTQAVRYAVRNSWVTIDIPG